MLIEVDDIRQAGKVYTRNARIRGLPPSKAALRAVPGRHGPVIVRCRGAVYTLYRDGKPVKAG